MNTISVGRSNGCSALAGAPWSKTRQTGRDCSVVLDASMVAMSNVACVRAISMARSRVTSETAVGHVAASPVKQIDATAIVEDQRDISMMNRSGRVRAARRDVYSAQMTCVYTR